MANMLRGRQRILDPFGGTGKVFLLEHWLGNVDIEAVEIEPEWAAKHSRTTLGNALGLPWADGYFDAICTSPTYGNRMADGLRNRAIDLTYAGSLRRKLHPDNSGQLQWGDNYRDFHKKAWIEARRVLAPGGVFVLNIKDHIREGNRSRVTDWHIGCLESIGFRWIEHKEISTPSYGYGQNSELRVPYESVILFALEAV
jgi:tRNA G10  N-methylase Trm11